MLEVYSGNNFEEIYSIMKKSFPKSEIRSKKGQEELLKDKRYKLFCYKKEGTLVGILCVWHITAGYFLEHFAVLPEFRGKGIGFNMLKEFIAFAKDGKKVFLEAEPIVDEITLRRINFYKRSGFYLNGYEYCQPSFGPSLPAVPLKIMTYGKAVSEEEFLEIKRSVYTEVYNKKI